MYYRLQASPLRWASIMLLRNIIIMNRACNENDKV